VVRRREEDGIRRGLAQGVHRDAAIVDGEWHGFEPVAEHRTATIGVPGVFDGDPATTARLDELRDEVDGLREAVADDDVVRYRSRATNAVEIRGQRIP
jgi:hypothetical protein